jgi:hypothetical protein
LPTKSSCVASGHQADFSCEYLLSAIGFFRIWCWTKSQVLKP